MRLIVCESCEAEFKIRHSLDEGYYKISFCPFCAEPLNEEFEDEMEWEDEDE